MQESSKLWYSFEQCTQDILPIEANDNFPGEFLRIDSSYATSKLNVELPQPYMVFFILARLKKFEFEYQPIEKVLWEIPFKYKTKFFYFTVRKMGFRLMANTEDITLLKEVITKFHHAIKIVDKMLSPLLKEVVNQGDITFKNQSAFLRERYLYFRNKAKEAYQYKRPNKNDSSELFSGFYEKVKSEKEGFFNSQAMLEAYFSFQEHLLILLLPFSGFNKDKERVSDIIAEDWSVKFNKVFNPSKNAILMKHYDNLRTLKERYRNKYSHGAFEKKDGSLYAKVENLGFIPVRLNRSNEFSLVPIQQINFEEICKVIDEFEHYLSKSKDWSLTYKLIQSGIDIYFDDHNLTKYRKALESKEALQDFLKYQDYLYERNTNMDW
jgi:hypothetical protein